MNFSQTSSKRTGFSLVEMLVVIAVIGIVAAIAIPTAGKINKSAKNAKSQRNAQTLASVFFSAQASGLDFYRDTKEDLIAAIVAGGTVSEEGPYLGTYFGVPSLAPAEQSDAGEYLELDTTNRLLVYTGVD